MNEKAERSLPTWLPFVVGALLVVQFAGLGGWQVSRGLEKHAQQDLFSDESGFSVWSNDMTVRPYQRLTVAGRLDNEHQFLLENIILNGRYGYYVLTPLQVGGDHPLLIVNRGWVEKTAGGLDVALLALDDADATVSGRAGSLPRAAYRMGEAITAGAAWPQRAVYPTLDDLAAALGRDVQPFVLLMDSRDQQGFVRHWVPEEMGPARHFGYALQWFAMGTVLAALLVWHYRRRRARNG